MARRRRDHTVCKVQFEDGHGHLQDVTIRIPSKVPITSRTVTKFVEGKTHHRVRSIFAETCTTARRSQSHALPRKRS